MQRFTLRKAGLLAQNVQVRKSSTAALLDILQRDSVKPQEVENLLKDRNLSASDLEQLHSSLKSKVSNDIANEILRFGLAQDFSLYHTLSKLDTTHKWNDSALLSLIENNPGRVQSLMDLMKKHSGESVSTAVRHAVLKKLLHGEKAEVRDGEFELTEDGIRRAIAIFNQLESIESAQDHLETIFEYLLDNNAVAGAGLIEVEGFPKWLTETKLSLVKEKRAFLQIAKLIFDADRLLLSKEVLSKVLAHSATVETFEHDAKASKVLANLGIEESKIAADVKQLEQFGDEVLAYVEENHLDLDKRDAEALLLRMQLIQTYGIDRNQIQTALEKFHHYQTHEKFGVELVQSKLVQAFCYQSFKHFDEMSYKIAETLVAPEDIPVTTICHLILASSQFDEEKALAIYNDYIGQLTNKTNAVTGRSPAGILTESMMIASLFNNDREFAQLLFEKAISANVVAESDIPHLKKVFKVYGEAFDEDSWEKAKPLLLEYVLNTIRRL